MAGANPPGSLGSDSNPGQIDPGTLSRTQSTPPGPETGQAGDQSGVIPGRAFFFVLADEVLPSGKLVRKVLQLPQNPQQMMAAHPEVFGLKSANPGSNVSLAEHALGNNNSRYISASAQPGGAPNIGGRPVYIDIAKAEKAGVIIHKTEDILADLDRLARQNPGNSGLLSRIEKLKNAIKNVEMEVLLEGKVPREAIKSGGAMTATRALRAVQFIGFVLTAYDLTNAGIQSVEAGSVKPITAETIRQVGGWGAAWAGLKIGFLAGAAVGIETGPGAVVSGGVGALLFGAAGYFGADWVADLIHEN